MLSFILKLKLRTRATHRKPRANTFIFILILKLKCSTRAT
jgi:hypothetical protein